MTSLTAADHPLSSIAVGDSRSHRYRMTEQVYQHFLSAFEDTSPVHVDQEFARARGFRDRVMHGAILNGFVSHFVGVVFPGWRSLLLTVDMRYSHPCYLGDELELTANVTQVVASQSVVVLGLAFRREADQVQVAQGRAQIRVEDG